jgi:methylenetetrahydrofolate reductase (NADPH)
VVRIKTQTSLDPIPHLTCVCHQEPEIQQILEQYAKANVSNILALGGDPPRDMPNYDRSKDAFRHAAQLVAFIRKFNASGIHPDKRGFGIGVAGFPEGHPGTPNRLLEMDYLKAKVDAGADYICTQLFFDNRDFYDFRERCDLAGIKVPIIAGLMPITSSTGLRRMAELSAGSRFPARLLKSLARAGNNQEMVKRVGTHWATEQCRDLLDNKVAGIHFYTLNKSDVTRQIYANLGVEDSAALQ